MISALKTFTALAAAPAEQAASVIEATKATDFVMEENFETTELFEAVEGHEIKLQQDDTINEAVGLIMLHAVTWSSFFNIFFPALFFTELNKKELRELDPDNEFPPIIKWFFPDDRSHYTKRIEVMEQVFFINVIPATITTILGWFFLTTGPNPLGWVMRIWLQHGLSNILMPMYLYSWFRMLSLLVGPDKLGFEMRSLAPAFFYMGGSFFALFMASPGVSYYLTGIPDEFSSVLFPSIFYMMGWVEYDSEDVW